MYSEYYTFFCHFWRNCFLQTFEEDRPGIKSTAKIFNKKNCYSLFVVVVEEGKYRGKTKEPEEMKSKSREKESGKSPNISGLQG